MEQLIRTDGSSAVGMGHVKRCLALAPHLQRPPTFALRLVDDAVLSLIRQSGYRACRLEGRPEEEAMELRALSSADGILLDLSNRQTRAVMEGFSLCVKALIGQFARVSMIDGADADALADLLECQPQRIIIPYAGIPQRQGRQWFIGPRYFILDPDFTRLIGCNRLLPDQARRVLVTCGGADPCNVTQFVLRAFAGVPEDMDVRVVIGPAFRADAVAEISDLARQLPHQVTLERAPESLADLMLWCDMAVATTGLTKYELAAMGVPAILLSPDHHHDLTNRGFAGADTAIDLGALGECTTAALARQIVELAGDAGLRERLSSNGRRLLDGQGARRVAELLEQTTENQTGRIQE